MFLYDETIEPPLPLFARFTDKDLAPILGEGTAFDPDCRTV